MNIFSYIYPVPSYKNRSWIDHSGKVSQLYCYKITVIFRYIQMLFSCLLPVLLGEESQAMFSQNCRSYHFIGRRFTDKVYKCFTMLSEFFSYILRPPTFSCYLQVHLDAEQIPNLEIKCTTPTYWLERQSLLR